MKVISQGYKKEGFTILLVPETEAERKEFIDANLIFSSTINRVMGLLQVHIQRF